MNPTCKKRFGAIRLETMKVVAQEEIAPKRFLHVGFMTFPP